MCILYIYICLYLYNTIICTDTCIHAFFKLGYSQPLLNSNKLSDSSCLIQGTHSKHLERTKSVLQTYRIEKCPPKMVLLFPHVQQKHSKAAVMSL